MTMTTGVISVLSDVDAGSLNKGTKVEGKMEEGPDSDSSMILRSVITNRNADCWNLSTMSTYKLILFLLILRVTYHCMSVETSFLFQIF